MTDDFTDRLRDLPPQLPDLSDRLDRVCRIVSRRRHRQVGLVGVATVLAIVVPVAVVSGLPGSPRHSPARSHVPTPSAVAEVAQARPASGLTITALPAAEKMTHSPAQAHTAFTRQGASGRIVDIYPAVVTDPIAAKLGLGSATTPRRMWVFYRLTTVPAESNTGDPGTPVVRTLAGTRLAQASLLDDTTLHPGGNFAGNPVSATMYNVGYGIANGSRVGATGMISPAGDGEVLCFIGGGTLPDTIPSSGPECVGQVALSGGTRQLSRWSGARYVTGTWQASGLLVTSIGPAHHDDSDPFGQGPPCPTPPSGWARVAPSPTPTRLHRVPALQDSEPRGRRSRRQLPPNQPHSGAHDRVHEPGSDPVRAEFGISASVVRRREPFHSRASTPCAPPGAARHRRTTRTPSREVDSAGRVATARRSGRREI